MEFQTAVHAVETHISWVFFTADRAYKLLKPVTLDFLDYSKPQQRLEAAEREYEVNRRFAPDVYLGLADVHEDGVLTDRMIVMRRLPADRCLSRLAGAPEFSECLREVARMVATFHAAAPALDDAPMATRDAVLSNWEGNLADIRPQVGTVIAATDFDRLERLVRRYVDNRGRLFEHRIAEGHVREGHGDLVADDIYCLDDGPRIIDCLAFSDDWRIGDVLADIGFLVMDVQRLAGAAAASDLLGWYQEFSNERHPASLAHHYVAYRAHVRAKIACLRYAQGDEASAELARTYHDLALDHLERGRIRLILVGGGPGVGKSSVARGLSEHFGYPVLVTDEIRKDITETPRNEHRFAEPGRGIYDPAITDAAYAEMIREARVLLEHGEGVVLDASWNREVHRELARRLALENGADLVELECVLPPAIAKERIARRLANTWDPSDATPDVVDYLAANRDRWPAATSISTKNGIQQVVAEAVQITATDPPFPI